MIITLVAVLIIVSVPLTGGSLERMSQVRFSGTWLVMGSLAVQLAITTVLVDAPYPALLAAAHLSSYVLASLFLWRNRKVPGLLVIAAGGIANFVAIGANGGVMPASAAALEMAGMTTGAGFENSAVVEGARLQFLGDVFAIPAGWPLANVFSIGDVVLLIGVAVLVHRVGRWPAVADEPAAVVEPVESVAAVEPVESVAAAEPVESVAAAEPVVAAGTELVPPCCDATRPHRCCTGARRGRDEALAAGMSAT